MQRAGRGRPPDSATPHKAPTASVAGELGSAGRGLAVVWAPGFGAGTWRGANWGVQGAVWWLSGLPSWSRWQALEMEPVLTPEEMTAVDAAAADRMDELVQRAGAAVARQALRMLGGAYGRRVHVMAGPGNNGADGRVAAELLRRRGVRVSVGTHDQPVPTAVAHDLLIDAAFGTGLSRPYEPPPAPGGVPVLAVDIPSGLDGLTGELRGRPWRADATITFAALKSGLILGEGPEYLSLIHI